MSPDPVPSEAVGEQRWTIKRPGPMHTTYAYGGRTLQEGESVRVVPEEQERFWKGRCEELERELAASELGVEVGVDLRREAEARVIALEAELEQWPPIALALVRRQPVRNLDERIAGTELLLRARAGERET